MLRRAGRNADGKVVDPDAAASIRPAKTVPSGCRRRMLPARLLLDSADPDAAERDIDGDEIMVVARSVVLIAQR